MADDDSNIQIVDDEYDITDDDFIDKLSSPFSKSIAEDEITQDEVDEKINPIDVDEEDEEDSKEYEIEILRRQVNMLKQIVDRDNDTKKYAQCIDSVFSHDVKFEIAWNYVVSKMQYDSLANNTAILLSNQKLNTLKSNLDKIRRIVNLVRFTRTLGSFTLESQIVDTLISKEFDIKPDKNGNDVVNKLEKLLETYASKIKNEPMI